MSEKIVAIILAVMMVVVSVTAFADFEPRLDTGTECSITVAGSFNNFEALEEQFDFFAAYYPNVELSYVYLDDYNSNIGQTVVSDECPDIVMTKYYHWEPSERYENLQEAAEDLSDAALGIRLDTIVNGIIYVREDGSVPSMPMFMTSCGMLVNEDIFASLGLKVPETLSELMTACQVLKDAGYASPIAGYDRGSDLYQNVCYPLLLLYLQEHPDEVQAMEQMVSGEAVRTSLVFLREMVEKGYINREYCANEFSDNYNAAILRFFEGDIPMLACTTGTASGTAKRENKSEAFMANPFTYSFRLIPVTEEGGYICTEYSECLTVNTNSSNLEMANEFLRFVSQPENLNRLAERKGMPSVTTVATMTSKYDSLKESLDHALYTFDIGVSNEILSQYRKMLEKAARTDTPIDEIIAGYPYDK